MKPPVGLSVEREGAASAVAPAAPHLRPSLANDIRATLQAEIETGERAPGTPVDERFERTGDHTK